MANQKGAYRKHDKLDFPDTTLYMRKAMRYFAVGDAKSFDYKPFGVYLTFVGKAASYSQRIQTLPEHTNLVDYIRYTLTKEKFEECIVDVLRKRVKEGDMSLEPSELASAFVAKVWAEAGGKGNEEA